MTPDQLSALPPGTEVFIRATVTGAARSMDAGWVRTTSPVSPGALPRNFHARDIECVAPPRPPKPLEVGDSIYHVEATTGSAGKLIAIYGRHAVVRFPSNLDYGFDRLANYVRAAPAPVSNRNWN